MYPTPHNVIRTLLTAAVLTGLITGSAAAQTQAEQARAVRDTHKEAVVTVRLTVGMSMPGGQDESTVETTGVLIDPSGLTVIALSQTDPMAMLSSMMGGMMGGRDMQIESEVKDAQLLLDDGTEVPATVVLRDQDLDLAFLRPLEVQTEPLPHITLDGAGGADIFDPLVVLHRMGKVVSRACGGVIDSVQAKVDKPRLYYVPSMETMLAMGGPVFTLDGKFIGILVMRTIKSESTSMNFAALLSGATGNMTPIVVPADDIAIGAGQAPEPADNGGSEAPAEEETESAPAE